ncbi:MAG TPA: OmpA family protein [Xanthobacteraceae bacterium]|nr:OmpA family protein [Xanthobacteraceae bacterium]
MWRLIAAAVFGVFCVSGALAQQQVSGQVRNLVFPAETLVFKTDTLVFKVENLAGQVQSLQVKETATEIRIELAADILFDFDKADIRPAAETALKQVGDLIRTSARGAVTIEGHTDAKGSPAYNEKLSQRRSTSVQKWLVEREGLRQVRFQIKGFGASRPVAPNAKPDGSDDPEGRQKNRRVEIVFARR